MDKRDWKHVVCNFWWGKSSVFCVFLPRNRGEHGRVPARDVHRGCTAGPHAVAAQEAEGELISHFPSTDQLAQKLPKEKPVVLVCVQTAQLRTKCYSSGSMSSAVLV